MQEAEKQKKCDRMEKKEFKELIGQELSDEDYEIIETVYRHHPAVKGVSGEEEVAELYKSFGMTIFQDMIGRARRNQDLEHRLYCAQEEVDRIKGEMIENNYGQMPDQAANEVVERKDPHDIASKVVNMLIAEYINDGFSLADVKEIFSIIEEHFVDLKIKFLDP